MREVKRWTGSELFLGAVYGLGMSLAVWIPLNTGTLEDSWVALLCLAAALAGVSRSWAGWPAPAALPWVAAAWVIEGTGAAMLVAVVATVGSGLTRAIRRTPGRLAYDAGSAALALAAADGLAATAGGSALVMTAAFGLVLAAFQAIRRLLAGTAGTRWLRNASLTGAILVAGYAASWMIVTIWSQPSLRFWLVAAPAFRLGAFVGSAIAALRRRKRRCRQLTAHSRLRDRTAAALARTLPEGASGGHLWRVEALCAALAERLGAEPVEIRRLRQAALLHHVGRLAYDDAEVEVHPRVIETTIGQLGFSHEVREILIESQEHWNGDGPRGLRGERICRSARILAVADRYDQLAHPASGSTRPHAEALTWLRSDPGERFDPLMFEILDELAEPLEATASDLTRPADPAHRTPCHTRLVDAERDLQTLYSIERAAALPIGLRERFTLIAGLLRTVVPFERLCIEVNNGDEFRYGDRDTATEERTLALSHEGETVGRLTISAEGAETLGPARTERLERVGVVLAGLIAAEDPAESGGMTDPATGLPNARYLKRVLALRIPERGQTGPGFGLIAFHVSRLSELARNHGRAAADRFLYTVAQRLAAACDERETLVRLGPDQFLVLTGESRGGELVRRWHTIVDRAVADPVVLSGGDVPIRLDAAHAAHPLDGDRLDDLLRTLEARLTGSTTTSVLPFRARRAG